MSKYDNVDYAITPMMKSVRFVTSDGESFEDSLSTVHVRSVEKLQTMPAKIAATIAPGSLAHVTGMDTVWQKGFDGTWEEVEF